jgi:hypothetical protein
MNNTKNEKKKTMKFLFPAVLLVPVLAALIPCTANAQVDPGGYHNPEATPAAAPATQVTGTVAVSSLPAITGTVGVSGVVPVIIGNTPSAPVYTASSDAAHRRPYVLSSVETIFSQAGLSTVPKSLINGTSQLFVITSFSSWASMNASDILMNCLVNITNTGVTGGVPALGAQSLLFPEIFSGVNMFPGTVNYSANAGVLMYLMPGQNALLSCLRGPAPGQTLGNGQLDNVYVTLTGHLEDLPPVPAP